MTKCFLRNIKKLKEQYILNPEKFVRRVNSYDILQTDDNGEILEWVDTIVENHKDKQAVKILK